jgi:hypothetical protein
MLRSYRPLLFVLVTCSLTALGCGGFDPGPLDDDDVFGDDDDAISWPDADGDSISDADEGSDDADGDGIPNDQDLDSDNDGISDADEAGDSDPGTPPVDSDGDGIPDFLDDDSDGNGIPDAIEGGGDADGDGVPDSSDLDNDGDGIPDVVELGGDPSNPVDSDGDGTPDWLDEDSDGDHVPDSVEGADDPDGDGIPSYLDLDSDGDGIADVDEAGSDPTNPPDSDGDGYYDFEDADSDNDGIGDGDESAYGTSVTQRDSDGDGFSDLAEITAGSNPNDASSVISGFYAELSARVGTTLEVPFTPEILMADVLFLLDTTCSMQDVLDDVRDNFSQVVTGLSIPSVAYGVAEFDDYAMMPFGNTSWGDRPYRLLQQVTGNTTLVQSALNGLGIRDGEDWPESGMEALFQAATGLGYDQSCNGSYQWDADVPPFLAGPSDAFGGSTSGVYLSAFPGQRGGAGFRDGAVPVIVYATDAEIRDPDIGYSAPASCSNPAGNSDVISAVNTLGGKLIGVAVAGNTPPGADNPVAAMNNLANQTGSLADLDGNGFPEPLVYQGTSGATVANIIAGIGALAQSGEFDLSLVVDDAPYGFVQSINPVIYTDVPVGTEVTFEVTLLPSVPLATSDQVFIFAMQVLADGGAVLAQWDLVIVVLPG